MICDKCKKEVKTQEHHLLPKYMDNPHGYSWKDYVSRVELCLEHHTELQGIHQVILYPIIVSYSKKKIPYSIYAESQMWKCINPKLKDEVKDLAVKKS